MTQENKLELINYLVEELAKEVEKQGLSLALAIKVENDKVITGSLGKPEELSECISILAKDFEDRVGVHYEDFKKKLDGCDCPICKGAKEFKVNDTLNYGFPSEVLSIFLSCLFDISEKEKEHDRN